MNLIAKLKLIRRLAFIAFCAMPVIAAGAEQKTFATPDEAVDALLAALKADDDAALVAIFGDKHKDADRHARPGRELGECAPRLPPRCRRIASSKSRAKDRRVLLIGDQAWPLPIPLVRVGERWRFATEEGEDEIVNRRIGANERSAIEVLRAYLDAQKRLRRARPQRRRRAAVRAAARQHAGQARRTVLAGRCGEGRGSEPVRTAGRGERGVSQGPQARAIRTAAITSGFSRARARARPAARTATSSTGA